MRLCSLLGIPNQRVLDLVLTPREYEKWQAFYACDPWDQDRYDLRNGQLISAILAPWAKRPPSPEKFMLYARPKEKPTQSENQQKSIFRAAMRGFARASEKMKKPQKDADP